MTDREKKKLREGLEYITNSPKPEHGGFHSNTVEIAKSALSLFDEVDTLRKENKELGRRWIRNENQISDLQAKLSNARKCEFCGGTDLVCGKGWQEERDKLKGKIEDLKDCLLTRDSYIDELRAKLSEKEKMSD